MAKPKYINTKDVVTLTGLKTDEVYALIKEGKLPAHKAPRSGWRLNVDSVESYFGIMLDDNGKKVVPKEQPKAKIVKKQKVEVQNIGTKLISDNEHYYEVIERIAEAKSSIQIATANFKKFRMISKRSKKYTDGTPFVKTLVIKAAKGVKVDVICSLPSDNLMEDWLLYLKANDYPKQFRARFCERNHSKLVIIDKKIAYIGSANITGAGLGQGTYTAGNFETGILTDDPTLVRNAVERFEWIWSKDRCAGCHRKGDCRPDYIKKCIAKLKIEDK